MTAVRPRYRPRSNVEVSTKSPMEDFLFILVIALAVSISFFAKKQMADRFALVEKKVQEESVSAEEYSRLPKCISSEEGTFRLGEMQFESKDEFLRHIARFTVENAPRIVLKIHRDRTIGEVEDVKNALIDRQIEVLTEWETRK